MLSVRTKPSTGLFWQSDRRLSGKDSLLLSLVLAMLVSSAVGTLIPLFFKKIKVDPAVASGPLITTVNDLVAVVAYYGLSWLFQLNVLHLA